MTFTEQTIETLTIMAGADYAWTCGGTSRPESGIRAGIMAFLADYAGNRCAFCGDGAAQGEVCHIISGGKGRNGWTPGNLAWGCLDCNDLDGERGEVVSFETILAPELIPTMWPTNKELRTMGMAAKEAKENARKAKAERRGM